MDIREIDLADDALMESVYGVDVRSSHLGRESMPMWTHQEFLGAYRTGDSGERQLLLGAFEGDTLLGYTALWFPLLDNLDKVYVELHVDPPARRRGIGRALLAEVEAQARADGRRLLLADSKMPPGQRETHPYRRFADATGFEFSNVEVVRHLPLPVPEERLEAWLARAAERHEGHTIATYVDEFPDELAKSLCTLLGQLAVDAPTGLVDFEEEDFNVDRLKERYATTAAMGRSLYETVALSPDGEVAAQSTLAVAKGEGTDVFQWGTFVHRDHRGHRLGLAVKVANIKAVQDAHPDKRRITTQNAESNAFMVDINKELGFEAVEDSMEWIKRL
ncbi:GNAT family N-acetyltransferase [Nocardioides sp.]|uniref:GNAT family N-acetyltransferase n=1 Tax=Nocardioides sp. TaxID=35761 RepID=UPI001A2E2C3E|nr:GNAT family N-acetyltransferase [Nocardioides sp.]MBJ7355966.1 GNAT family N-acetyltransferase [Nocardioides sp.]